MDPLSIYLPTLEYTYVGLFGTHKTRIEYTEMLTDPILKLFWNNNDIQEITITSTNMGFSKTLSKNYIYTSKPELKSEPKPEITTKAKYNPTITQQTDNQGTIDYSKPEN